MHITRRLFDPRAWSIAGLCVTSGCGDRAADDSSESSASESGAECQIDADCPNGLWCQAGICIEPPGDEYGPGFCEDESWCEFGLCINHYCAPLPYAPDCEAPDPAPLLEIPTQALALSFVDVDADGAHELVVATQSELAVYESGSDIPITSPRGLDSDSIEGMAGGELDGNLGADVVLVVADELRLHASDGLGNFAAPTLSAAPVLDCTGVRVVDLDGVAPADSLYWGSGAALVFGSGEQLELDAELVTAATTRATGFALGHDSGVLRFHATDGTAIDPPAQMYGAPPHALTSIVDLGQSFDASATTFVLNNVTAIEQWDPATGTLGQRWGLWGIVTAMAGGDFDGDARADVAMISHGRVLIVFGMLEAELGCKASYVFPAYDPSAAELAVGDHDGDGDDELAVRYVGAVVLLDGE